jgi:hypothetical protein
LTQQLDLVKQFINLLVLAPLQLAALGSLKYWLSAVAAAVVFWVAVALVVLITILLPM